MSRSQQYRIKHCEMCREGDTSVACFGDDPKNNGICPIFESIPILDESNTEALDVFYAVVCSAEQVEGKDKNYVFIKPSEIESVCRMKQISLDERELILTRVFILQDISNRLRSARPKPPIARIGRR